MCQGHRQRGQEENQKTDNVDNAEDDDGNVFAQVLVGNDGTEDGSDWRGRSALSRKRKVGAANRTVAPELEEGRETRCTLVTHAQSTATLALVGLVW